MCVFVCISVCQSVSKSVRMRAYVSSPRQEANNNPLKTITGEDNADDLVFPKITPALAELHCLERAKSVLIKMAPFLHKMATLSN